MKKEVKKVPQLRFPEFTGDWEQRKLNEITDVRDGTHDSPKYVQEGHPFITSKNVSNGFIDYNDIQYVTDEDYDAINKRSKVDVHDILMGMIGTIGNLALIRKEPDFAIKNVALIKYTGDIDYQYLYQALQADCVTRQLSTGMDGGTQKFVSLKKIRELDIPFPKEYEQQKIGVYFSKLDNLITLHQRKLEKIKKFKKGVMQKLFSQEVRFKADDESDFPEWEEKKLGKVADIYDGVHQTPEYVSSGVKFVSVENIESIYSTNKYITQKAFERDYKNNIPKKWDILMTRIGDVGRVALIDDDEQLAYYVSLALIRVSSDFVPQFFVQALRSDFFQAELWRNMLHTAYPKKINKQDIGKCKVKFPVSIAEQQKIADCLSALDEVIEKQKATLAVWEELKKGLLQQMFV